MKLQRILYEGVTTDSAVLVGRYQPFHIGHHLMYKEAKKHFKHVYIGMATKKVHKPDNRNPFTNDERERFIRQADSSLKIIRVGSLYYEKIWDAVGKEVALVIGPDREKDIERMGGTKDGSGKFEYYTINKRFGNYSSTNVRNALKNADEKEFKKYMHKGNWKEFDFMVERYAEVLK